MNNRVIDIASNIMAKNDALAAKLRDRFARSGTCVVNILSSPGSGKTTLLEETLRHLVPAYRVAALVGDQATANDSERLARSGAPVRQITTGEECRLDAEMITKALEEMEEAHLDALFIENVGNLICPAEYDLGEDLRVVLFSVTEGEDKPLKYPLAFNTAHLAVVTKIDIAEAVGYDRSWAFKSIYAVNPAVTILELSARSGAGMSDWMRAVEDRIRAKAFAPAT